MKPMRENSFRSAGIAAFLGLMAVSFAVAPVWAAGPGYDADAEAAEARGEHSVAGPYYNPRTNTYFELFRTNKYIRWHIANARAMRKMHDGERGYLANMKDLETLRFVRERFEIDKPTWIGVRYFCKYSKLLWADGKLKGPKMPGMWHPRWYRNDNVRCGSYGYMPIYLTPPGYGGIFWQASGPTKVFAHYLVEYPAPKHAEDNAEAAETPPQQADAEAGE